MTIPPRGDPRTEECASRTTRAAPPQAKERDAPGPRSVGSTQHLIRIGELARRTGAGKATIEHCPKCGLIEPAGVETQGYRLFGPEAVARIALLKRARLAGFGLPEVRAMFAAVPLPELDELLITLPPLRCRRELRARGVALASEVA